VPDLSLFGTSVWPLLALLVALVTALVEMRGTRRWRASLRPRQDQAPVVVRCRVPRRELPSRRACRAL